MKKYLLFLFIVLVAFSFTRKDEPTSWIRINQLGYKPGSVKVAVWCSKENTTIQKFELVDSATGKTVYSSKPSSAFGSYGPFKQTYRLSFSAFKKTGKYYLKAGNITSPVFTISDDVYKGAADFCLRYMRQQRSGFNPFLKDSCHTQDGYTLYGKEVGLPDSTHIDVSGGWHDASDYLQYATTSANATYHLLMAYRDFPTVFTDQHLANGLEGENNLPDVMDEAKWGINWLLKMFPQKDQMFNQLGDDRDHISMRIPKMDSQYGKGFERPVYFIDGEKQQRGKFLNNTTGTSSTAAKFASVFALAQYLYSKDSLFRSADKRNGYYDKAFEAYRFAQRKPGVTQTVSVKSPYIYAEDNWVDDMELASASIHQMVINTKGSGDNGYYSGVGIEYAKKEKITPWLGADTASHYQWYPFINIGHYELIKQLQTKKSGPVGGHTKEYIDHFWDNTDTLISYYKEGINRVWNKARQNAFYRGVPFIWCSNNLTVSFATQCYWYRQLTNDKSFEELEQANIDWLFGCNPWGTSMVYGLPSWGDSPVDPHSAFTHLKNYPIDGGLVDGPVYTSIFNSLIGLTLYQPDEYAAFQSELAVYHDDYGDYSTNEPTMDGTASLIYLLAAMESPTSPLALSNGEGAKGNNQTKRNILLEDKAPSKGGGWGRSHGAIIRGDTTKKNIALVFTGHEFADGGAFIAQSLKQQNIKASFFFTGDFYRNVPFRPIVQQLKKDGHYIGAHSDKHLLYADWNKRDSLLVTKEQFKKDLLQNYTEMKQFGISKSKAVFFLPPYEWYNDSVAAWTQELGLQLINYSPGTKSNADYTNPADKNYQSSEAIYQSILQYEQTHASGLNGFILLVHIGTAPHRTDKFYLYLPKLLKELKQKGYQFKRVDELLSNH